MSSFVHLHVHSLYSPMEGTASLEALCQAALAQGAEALALTDTNGLYGAVRFVEVAREAGLRPILGAELVHARHRAVLLVKTAQGYANLCRLLSARHCDADFVLIPAVARHRQGLLVLSDDSQALTAWKQDSPEDLYVELTPGAMMHEALAFSRRSGLPPVATNRVRFVHPHEFSLHRLLRAIALNTTLSRLPADACCAPGHWLAPPPVLAPQFPHVPHALANAGRIAGLCKTDWDFKDTIFPAFRALSDREAFALLRERTYAGAARRYGAPSADVVARIERELAVIRDKGYAHYFLIVDEIVRQAPRTCGRGSAAASIVSYCLGITHVEPLRHHLFFERFLNAGRHDPPDIDIDFPWDERDRILDFVFTRYGTARAAMVANQNSLGMQAAFREVAKVYGMPPAEIARMTQHLAVMEVRAPGEGRTAGLSALPPPWPEILRLAGRLTGRFRHLSLHCGGVVIVPDDLRRYVPVEVAAKGVPVIQWEKDQCEDAGLVKIDILGNRSLSVIRDALEAVARNTGRRIEYAAWNPLSDPPTQELIRRGETMGCFYIESPATRLLLTKLWRGMPADRRAAADVFDYLVIVSSLIRPAANRFIREFVRRAHGASFPSLHPVLDRVLADTHGIMVYQEDVTRVAIELAGFSVEDGDQLRKVLTKKHKRRQLQDYRAQFFRGTAERGVPLRTVEAIWDMIMSFTGYSFCKPHSASYAQVSFKSAYLRAHYPAEFMAAVISNQGGFYSAFAYLSEARRMGLTVLPPDINASQWHYTGAGATIRVGFMQIARLSRQVADRLLADRAAHGPFRSWQDFVSRVRPEPEQARLLVRAGCLDSIAGELTRPALLWRLSAAHACRSSFVKRNSADAPSAISATLSDSLHASRFTPHALSPLPIPPEYSATQRARHEVELFGFPLSRHPLDLSRQHWKDLRVVPASAMRRHVGETITLLGWPITGKPVRTKDGEPMEFLSFEDQTAIYDVTVFPAVYRKVCHRLGENQAYVLRGVVEEEFGAVTLTLEDLHPLGSRKPASDSRKARAASSGGAIGQIFDKIGETH